MTSTESYTVAADQARTAVERSAQIWQQSTQRLTEQADAVSKLPQVDVTEVTRRYFEYLQRGLEVNRDFAVKWAEIVQAWTDVARTQVQATDEAARGHSRAVSDWLAGEAQSVQDIAEEQAEKVDQVQREQARAPYQDLTKAELADKLAERDLPKTGTVDELIDRLVAADAR